MTIGPEPMTRTDWMSVRLGIAGASIRARTKRSNRYAASCGPAAASGWYCTRNAGPVEAAAAPRRRRR